jgi:hypothetical protein
MARDGRITTSIVRPDGTHERRIPLPRGTLNLGCAQAYSARTGRDTCEGWSDKRPGSQGLYTIALDGRKLIRVTHCSMLQDDRPFAFSRDGATIFFLRSVVTFPAIGDQLEGSFYSVRADGTHLRCLTSAKTPVEVVGNAGGRLSPDDGRKIVFTCAGAIWTVGPTGRHRQSCLLIEADDLRSRRPGRRMDASSFLASIQPGRSRSWTTRQPTHSLSSTRTVRDLRGSSPALTGNASPIGFASAASLGCVA